MNKIAVAMTVMGLSLSGQAFAYDVVIDFTGNIVSNTCVINGNASPSSLSVTLPTVSAGTLTAAGMTAGRTPFQLELTDCNNDMNVLAQFDPTATIDQATGRLNNIGTAADVQIQILNSAYAPINLADNTNTEPVMISGGGGTMQFYAEYYSTGSAGPGTVESTAEVTLTYP